MFCLWLMGHEFDVNRANFVQKRRKRNQIPSQFFAWQSWLTKLQAPNTKLQRSSNIQASTRQSSELLIDLNFGAWSFPGAWCLVLLDAIPLSSSDSPNT